MIGFSHGYYVNTSIDSDGELHAKGIYQPDGNYPPSEPTTNASILNIYPSGDIRKNLVTACQLSLQGRDAFVYLDCNWESAPIATFHFQKIHLGRIKAGSAPQLVRIVDHGNTIATSDNTPFRINGGLFTSLFDHNLLSGIPIVQNYKWGIAPSIPLPYATDDFEIINSDTLLVHFNVPVCVSDRSIAIVDAATGERIPTRIYPQFGPIEIDTTLYTYLYRVVPLKPFEISKTYGIRITNSDVVDKLGQINDWYHAQPFTDAYVTVLIPAITLVQYSCDGVTNISADIMVNTRSAISAWLEKANDPLFEPIVVVGEIYILEPDVTQRIQYSHMDGLEQGEYYIRIVANNNFGSSSWIGEPLKKNVFPVSNMITNPKSGIVPLNVAVDGSSSSGEDGPLSIYQYFVDGQVVSEGQSNNYMHTFTSAGEHYVWLKVYDGYDWSPQSAIDTITVTDPIP